GSVVTFQGPGELQSRETQGRIRVARALLLWELRGCPTAGAAQGGATRRPIVHTPTPKVRSDRSNSAAPDDRPRFPSEIVAPLPFEVRGDMRARVIWALFRERGMAWVPVVDETGHPIGTLLRSEL